MNNIKYSFIENNENFNVFKHSNNKKIGFFCINAYINKRKLMLNKDYSKILNRITNESKELNSLKIENTENNFRSGLMRSQIFSDKSGYSIEWRIISIDDETKERHDFFLKSKGYNRKIDNVGFYTEGCFDQKIENFIGGKNEVINLYCNLFPNSETCEYIIDSTHKKSSDLFIKGIFNNTEVSDKFFNGLDSYFNDK